MSRSGVWQHIPSVQLLDALDALVMRDAQAPMMRGQIAVGVRGAAGYRFWSARFDARSPTTARADTLPADSAVTLFLDQADADHILTTGQLPAQPKLLYIDGDRALMTRFLARYSGGKTLLGARVAHLQSAQRGVVLERKTPARARTR